MRTILSKSHADGTYLCLEDIGGAIAMCTADGELLGLTPSAKALFAQLGIVPPNLPHPLPPSLRRTLAEVGFGEATEWRPADGSGCLGCTRYPLGDDHVLLLMREVSAKQAALSLRLHQQRMAATGRLVATIAHDLRVPLASIIYNADVASSRRTTSPELALEIVDAIRSGAEQLRATIDGLLDFARLGPPLATDVSLQRALDRVLAFMRPVFREHGHQVTCAIEPQRLAVCGNPLTVEHILMNILLNASEASTSPLAIRVTAEPDRRGFVQIRIHDDGPGVPLTLRERIFDAFFTTKPHGTGLGLTMAREAAVDLGGDLALIGGGAGALFEVRLPLAADGAANDGAT
jgi:signal transduction histidine kinase